jgi:DNA-binding MarR family transcriptional regulator
VSASRGEDHLLRVSDGQKPRVLAKAFQTPKTSMTHTLAALETRGFIVMRDNPEDGRSKQVWLTDEGKQFPSATIALLRDDIGAFTGHIESRQVADVTSLLQTVRQMLDSARNSAR